MAIADLSDGPRRKSFRVVQIKEALAGSGLANVNSILRLSIPRVWRSTLILQPEPSTLWKVSSISKSCYLPPFL